ncbi:hypothetical protein STCU_04497 [Strigomonas culicis]|uniref:Rhodanese domain-containing protein n=1 Tax=Strigomonas culicis TaxID=28005 RepID=S9UL88_9TRYP|nr:hypothetical protein STCU_04497 [Strigomonas culicis]|eukprot:EPY29524.1 hypothetical protein STCU_04497 [Strigomonas culicis]
MSGRKMSLNTEALYNSAQPVEITAEELHEKVSQPHVTVVDVRTAEEYARSHVPNSRNEPFQEVNYQALVETLQTQITTEPHAAIVFVSAQSPDVDDLAAREFITAFNKAFNRPPPAASVRVLLGGFSHYKATYPN